MDFQGLLFEMSHQNVESMALGLLLSGLPPAASLLALARK